MIPTRPTFLLLVLGLASTTLAQDLRLVRPIGHTEMIQSTDYSPNGQYVITCSEDKTAIVWDAETGAELLRLQHGEGVFAAKFSPDGKSVFVSSRHFVKVWELETGKERYTELKGRLLGVLPAQPPLFKTLIATAENNIIRIWDAQSGKKLYSFVNSHWVTSVKFCPNGMSLIATQNSGYGTGDNSVRHWNLLTGEEFPPLDKHLDVVTSAEFSPDGKTILTASEDSNVRLWRAETGEELFLLPNHSEGVESAHFSPDGKTLVTGSRDHTARIWDCATGRELFLLNGHSDRVWAEYSLDGKKILTKSGRNVRIWDVKSGEELPSSIGHDDGGYISLLLFGADNTVFTSSSEGSANLWDVNTGQELYSFSHKTRINSATFSPCGTRLTTASGDWYSERPDNTARIWDLQTGEQLRHLRGYTTAFYRHQLTPDGTRVVSNTGANWVDVWDLLSGSQLKQLRGHSNSIYSSQISPDGTAIVTASVDSTAKIWNAFNGAELQNLPHPEKVYQATFSPNGEIAATISRDYTLRLWDVITGELVNAIQSNDDLIVQIQFGPDGQTLLSRGMSNTFVLREGSTGAEIATLPLPFEDKVGLGEGGAVAQYSPNGKTIITARNDEIDSESVIIQLWDASSGNEIRQIAHLNEQIYQTDFSPDGSLLLTGATNGTLRIWDLGTGKNVPLKGHSKAVTAAIFSPDGLTAVTGSSDHSVMIWDVKAGKVLFRLDGHTNTVNSIKFSPDGKLIVTASWDNTAKVWDAASGELLYTRMSTEDGGWLAWDPEYRYDGTPEAIEQMHFACGLEVIGLEQAEDALHVPGLVDYIMRGVDLTASGKTTLAELNLCNRTPVVYPMGRDDRGWLYEIEERNGGLSLCEIHVNGRLAYEVPQKQLPMQESGRRLLIVPESSVAKYISGESFELRVVARTLDGQLQSRSSNGTMKSVDRPVQDAPPQFHGLFVGINEYGSQDLQLNYAAADALEFSEAVVHAAGAFFGADRVHSKVLVTGATGENKGDGPAFKTAILNALEDIAEQSAPNDVVFLHFAGHGKVNSDNAFVFLSADASSKQIEHSGLTMQELNALLASMPANNRILVLDACESGAALGELDKQPSGARSDETEKLFRESQLNRLKKDADLAVITAAAAGQEAFELHEVGHGKLTFALLDALDSSTDIFEADGATVDVNKWFLRVQNALRDGSLGLGDGQDVQVMSARESYPVGIVDDALREAIQIERKPVVNDIVMLNSSLVPVTALEDALKKHCKMAMANGRAPFSSVMFREGQVDGLIVRGLKVVQGDDSTYSLNLDLLQGESVIGSSSIQGATVEAIWLEVQELAKLIQQ